MLKGPFPVHFYLHDDLVAEKLEWDFNNRLLALHWRKSAKCYQEAKVGDFHVDRGLGKKISAKTAVGGVISTDAVNKSGTYASIK